MILARYLAAMEIIWPSIEVPESNNGDSAMPGLNIIEFCPFPSLGLRLHLLPWAGILLIRAFALRAERSYTG